MQCLRCFGIYFEYGITFHVNPIIFFFVCVDVLRGVGVKGERSLL